MKNLYFMIGIVIIFILLPLIIKFLTGLRSLPAGTEKPSGSSQSHIICRHNSYVFSVILVICILAAGSFAVISFYLLSSGIPAGVMFVILDLMFIALTVMSFLWILNRVIILYPDKIIFRDCFGKVHHYSADQIEGFYVINGTRKEIRIHTNDKRICFNGYCTNFKKAWNFVPEHYKTLT